MGFMDRDIREKYVWVAVTLVYLTILSTLFIGRPLARELQDQNVQAIFFLLGMFLVAVATFLYGITRKPKGVEYAAIIGIVAVYVMFFFRLGAPERSHLIEYSVLAILLHKAFTLRFGTEFGGSKPYIYAWITGIGLGALDEGIQFFVPARIFDPVDIAFNALAVTMALAASLFLFRISKLFEKL